MTPTDTAHASPASNDGSVFLHGLDEIVTARRMKPALPPDDRTECELVTTDETDQQPGRKAADGGEQWHAEGES